MESFWVSVWEYLVLYGHGQITLLINGERKMMNEPLKIWEDLSLEIEATTVRVPSLYCHGEAVYVETIQDIDIDVLYDKYNQLDYIKT